MAKNITPKRKALRMLPEDFSMLGQNETVADVMQKSMQMVPSVVLSEFTVCPPLTDELMDNLFAFLENNVFGPPVSQTECPGLFTNLQSLQVTAPTIICGMCIVATAEGENFCQSGVLVDCPDGGVAVAPPAVLQSGCDGGALASAGQTPAVMHWGGPGWNFIQAFFRAYDVQVSLNQDCLILDVPASDVGMCEIAPTFFGAGDSCMGTMPFIRETNEAGRNNGLDCQFLPPNTLVTTDCAGVCASIDAPPPTAAVTWGHQMFTGRQPKWSRFPRPLLLFPAFSSVGVEFAPHGNNQAFKDQMRAALVASTKVRGASDNCGQIPPSECFTTASPTGGVGIGAAHWPGGKVTIGIRLMGYRVSYAFCIDYFYRMLTDWPGLAQVYGIGPAQTFVQTVAGKARQLGDNRADALTALASGNLAGLPSGDR
jgi:hypothetical protein